MNPKSKEEAFKIIDSSTSGIPFAAIKYLYTHDNDQEILDKVYFSIDNAYNDDIYYDKKTDYYTCTPLWYSIVAENHFDEKLINPVLKLFTTTEDDSDFLNEQGMYLLGELCKKHRKTTIDKCFDICIELNNQDSQLPYLFIFECMHFTKEGEYDSQILELLKDPNATWIDSLIINLCHPKFIKLLPRILEIQEYYQALNNKTIFQNNILVELKATIKTIRTSDSESLSHYPSYNEKRKHWELHYKSLEHIFKDEPVEIKDIKKKKIGRNDPCPCGSGIKYKKCCLML